MKLKVGVIVQARMGSTRLPGKVLKKLGSKTVLENVVERLQYCKKVDTIIVATTDKNQDNLIEKICKDINIFCFRGSEWDVLNRYYKAAEMFDLDIIVRVTSDCPLIDPTIIDNLVNTLIKGKNLDYVTNSMPPTFARGLECSAVTFKALKKSDREAILPFHREHVMTYIRENKEVFNIVNISNEKNDTKYRITLDEELDYIVLRKIYDALYKEGEIIDINHALNYLEKKKLYKVNENVQQKS